MYLRGTVCPLRPVMMNPYTRCKYPNIYSWIDNNTAATPCRCCKYNTAVDGVMIFTISYF